MLEPGTAAPSFTLTDHDGDSVTLPDTGVVVLYFYPRADTPGCTAQACGFRDNWEGFERRSVRVLGVSDDPVEELWAFQQKYELPISLLSDEDGAVARAYHSYGEKTHYGNTYEGVFRNTYLVDDGRIERRYEGVDPERHAETLLADIDAR